MSPGPVQCFSDIVTPIFVTNCFIPQFQHTTINLKKGFITVKCLDIVTNMLLWHLCHSPKVSQYLIITVTPSVTNIIYIQQGQFIWSWARYSCWPGSTLSSPTWSSRGVRTSVTPQCRKTLTKMKGRRLLSPLKLIPNGLGLETDCCDVNAWCVLALKHKSRILGQWSDPVYGSRKSQASYPWAKPHII